VITHLLDTDVCIDVIRSRDPDLAARLGPMRVRAAVSVITVHELHYGVERSSDPTINRSATEEFLANVTVLPLDEADAIESGEIRAQLARRGTPIGGYDVLMAGQARARSLILATGNVRELARVDGLRVEDWSRP
jgi:tRNA(fMet)-specific endonuclease VapC